MTRAALTFANARDHIGKEIAVTDWLTLTQDRVDLFAEATKDHDWLHTDPERARRESPFGGPVGHGFLTLSLTAFFSHEAGLWPEGTAYGVNYGLNRVRFIAPVPVGSRIRARYRLKDFAPRGDGGYQMTAAVTVEIEGQGKPAMVAEWLGLFYPAKAAAE